MSSIFISHSSADNSLAKELERLLAHQKHHSVFLDLDPEKGIVAGKSWEQTLYRKLRACRAVIAICTDNYLSSHWCFAEIALARMEGKEILALQADPLNPNSKMPSILTEKQFIDLRHNQEEGYERLWKGLRAMDVVGTDGEWDPRRPPYLGLNAYDEDDAGVFFGREEETASGLELLSRGAPNLIMILGASGSGKSSMVRAGIVPRLRQDAQQWLIVDPFRPGKDPFIELAQSLADTAKLLALDQLGRIGNWERIRDRLAAGQASAQPTHEVAPEGVLEEDGRLSRLLGQLEDLRVRPPAGVQGQLADFLNWTVEDLKRICAHDAGADLPPDAASGGETALTAITDELRRVCGRRNARVLLVIDQFEEMLGEDTRDSNASSFLAMLRASFEDDHSALMVLGTMRSDFLGVFQRHPAMQGVDFESLSLGPMKLDGMRRVIEEPAKLGAIELETGLPDRLLEDTETPDALPLLSFTLWVLWRDYRDDGKLDLSEYGQLGGLDGAVAGEANALLASARREGKEQALRDAFLRMVRITETGSYARRSAPWDAKELQPVHEILERFVDRRLLVSRAEGEARMVEVAHEALFRSWQPLKIWLDNHRAELLLKEQIRRDAETWHDHGRARDNLWRGGRLQQAIEMLDKGKLDGLQGEFVRSGLRRKRWLRATVVSITVAVIAVLAGFLWFAIKQANEAKNRAIAAEATLLWNPFDLQSSLSNRELEGLFTLARADTAVKRAFARHLKDDAALADKFSRQPKAITRALVGLDTAARDWLIQELLVTPMPKEAKPAVRIALGFLAAELEAGEGFHHLLEDISNKATTAESDQLQAWAEALAAVKLTPAQAEPFVARLLAVIVDRDDPDQLWALAKALAAFAAKLTAAQAGLAVDRLVAAIQAATNPYELGVLGEALAALAAKLTPAQAELAIGRLVAAIKDEENYDQLPALVQALAALPVELTPAQAELAVVRLVAAIQDATGLDQLYALVEALAALAAKLTAAQAGLAVDRLVAAIQAATNPYELSALAQALAALAAKLTPAQAGPAVDRLYAFIQAATDPYELYALVEALAALPVELPSAAVKPFVDKLVGALEYTTEPYQLEPLAKALAAIADKLPPAQAENAFNMLVAALHAATETDQIWALAEVLAALAVKLTPAWGEPAVDRVVAALQDTTEPYQLGQVLAKLTENRAPYGLIAATKDTTKPDRLWALAEVLAALAVKLTPAQVEPAVDRLVAATKDTTNPDQLWALAKALVALAGKLSDNRVFATLVFELLKYPIIKEVRSGEDISLEDRLLEAVRARFKDPGGAPAKEKGFWAMVKWAKKQFPDLDLKSPPK